MNKYILCFDTGFYFMQEVTIEIENDDDIESMIALGVEEVIKKGLQIDMHYVNDITDKEYKRLDENERYTYFDFTLEGLEVYFINLENFRYKKISVLVSVWKNVKKSIYIL